jgi:hypothetical protein
VADHVRQQIRGALVALLAGLPGVGAVYGSRVYPVSTLPAVSVFWLGDAVRDDLSTIVQRCEVRETRYEVRIIARALEGVDDLVDPIALEIEQRVAADPTLGGVAELLEYVEAAVEIEAGAEQPTALFRLVFVAHYRVDPADPTALV